MQPDVHVTPAAALCGMLATPERLKVVAALALGARTMAEVTEAAGLDTRQAAQALARLRTGGLVEQSTQGAWRLRTEVFAAAAAEPAQDRPDDVDRYPTADADAVRILRTFMPDGRLTAFPAGHGRRRVILDHVARAFELGVDYAEREVDAVLRAFCTPQGAADHVTLRRYLVDDGFLSRKDGRYWRSGGTVDLD